MSIRYGTFETNSSSAHTFVLRGDNSYVTNEEIENYRRESSITYENYLTIERSFANDIDFGRGFEILGEWHEKLAYLLSAFHYYENAEPVVNVVKKRCNVDGVLLKCYTDYWGEDEENNLPIFNSNWEEAGSFGSIDHQSVDCYQHAIDALRKDDFYKNMTLEEIIYEIIFCNKFVIVIDSDESWTFEKLSAQSFFKDAGFTHVLHERYEFVDDKYEYDSVFENFEEYMKKREDNDE